MRRTRAAWLTIPSPTCGTALAFALVLVALAHVPELFKAPVIDQADFELVAREMLAGKTLYRDLFDVKPPLIAWIYLGLRLLAGPGHVPIVLADLLARAATLVLVFKALRPRIEDRPLALGIAIWGMLESMALFSGEINLLQAETIINLLSAAVLWLVSRPRSADRPIRRDVLVGILAGTAALAKGPHALIIVGLLVALVPRGSGARAVLRAGPVAVVIVLAWVGSLAATGTLAAAIECFRYAAFYRDVTVAGPMEVAGQLLPYLLPALALAAWGGLGARLGAQVIALRVWALLASILVIAQGKYFGYHFLVMFPPVALLAGVGLDDLAERVRPSLGRFIVVIVLLWHLCWVVGSHVEPDARGLARVLGRRDQPGFDQTLAVTWWMSESSVREIAQEVARHSAPGDAIFVFGVMPQVYLWADRSLFGPYFFHYYLLAEGPLSSAYGDLAGRQASFMKRWSASPPRVVVVPDTQSPREGFFETGRELTTFPALVRRLAADYTPHRIGNVTVWVRQAGEEKRSEGEASSSLTRYCLALTS